MCNGTTSVNFPNWDIIFQQAALAALPRPPQLDQDTGLSWANGESLKKEFARLLLPQPASTPAGIIRVDRTVRPTYPNWVKKVMYPGLELLGPVEFDVSKLERYLHPDQKQGRVGGKVLYEHLKKSGLLTDCLGLTDLEAIRAKGLAFFRRHFAGKIVYGWRSVVQNADGYLNVPYAIEHDGVVVVDWACLDHAWNSSHPTLRFRK